MKKVKQIAAMICIIILVGLYVATLVLALIGSPSTTAMFKGCVALTIFVPVVAYIYICLHKYAMTRSMRKDYYPPNPPASSGDTSSSEDK